MVIDFYNRNGGGGGTADYATLAGEANKSKLLEGASAPPQSANTGDVVAIAPNPTRGLRSARTLGIYQYDGTNWNKIEGESSSAYKIELTEVNPQNYTQQDIDTINAFCAAFTADTSIADSAYISALNGIYRCVRYIAIPHSPIFTFEGPFNNNIVDISLIFTNDLFSYGGLQNAVPTPPIPEFTSIKPTTDFPENPVDGEIVLLSEEALIDYRPEAPNGQTVYGGNIEEFMVTLKGTSNNELWVKTWDDAGHTERTDQGYFHLENDAIDYYDYQGDMDYLFNDLNEGEWADANTIYLLKEGNNLYFYVKQEAEGVFFPDTDATMVFDTVITDNTLNQYDGGDWKYFPQALYGRADFPKNAGFGDVVALATEGGTGYEYGITFEEMSYDEGSIMGGRFTFPTTGYSELDGESYSLGSVSVTFDGGQDGGTYDLTLSYNALSDELILSVGDTSDPDLTVYMGGENENVTEYVNWMVFQSTLSNENYIIDIYPYTENDGETVTFNDIPTSEGQIGLYQYDGEGWKFFPQVLNSREDFPKIAGFGDVVGLGKTEEREATSADVFTSATVTMVNGRATFKMYNPNYSGYCDEYTFGYDVNEGIISPWGGSNNVINGPWNDQGVEFSIDGDDITFTTQNPENTSEALQMWGFDPNCNDRIVIKQLGIYQKDEEGWNRAVTSNSINSIVKLTQAEYDALVSGGTVDANNLS